MEFDNFCKKINHPIKSIQDAVQTTGVDINDVMALVNTTGFDFSLLNYASYVRTVSGYEVFTFLALTSATTTENSSAVLGWPNCRTGKLCALFPHTLILMEMVPVLWNVR